MNRALTAGLVLVLSAAFTTGAFASSKSFKGRADVQTALSGLGVVATSTPQLEKRRYGRTDLAFSSSTSQANIVAAAKKAYRMATKLPGKYQLVGYAKLDRRGSWSFTFSRDGQYSYAEVYPAGNGSKIFMYGYTHNVKRKTPLRHPRLPTVNR